MEGEVSNHDCAVQPAWRIMDACGANAGGVVAVVVLVVVGGGVCDCRMGLRGG